MGETAGSKLANEGVTVRLRHRRAIPNGLLGVLAVAALAYTFAGFWVFWLRTGSTTIGVGGTFSGIGSLVWLSPVLMVSAIVAIGDRGVFRRFFQPRDTVEIARAGMSWASRCAGSGRMDWAEIGGFSQFGAGMGAMTIVYNPQGQETVTLKGEFKVDGSRRRLAIPVAILAAVPDVFEAVDPRHPEKGCVRRLVSGVGRSVP